MAILVESTENIEIKKVENEIDGEMSLVLCGQRWLFDNQTYNVMFTEMPLARDIFIWDYQQEEFAEVKAGRKSKGPK